MLGALPRRIDLALPGQGRQNQTKAPSGLRFDHVLRYAEELGDLPLRHAVKTPKLEHLPASLGQTLDQTLNPE
jgi:hypothetical protein